MSLDGNEPVKVSDAVLTCYGVGVVVDVKDDFISVRLWRVPGRSVGSAARAALHKSSIISKLPVAPGMTTRRISTAGATDEKLLVLAYCKSTENYLVRNASDDQNVANSLGYPLDRSKAATSEKDSEMFEVSKGDLEPSKSAKFYPLLETLMQRGDQAKALASNVIENPVSQRIIKQTGEAVRSGSQALKEKSDKIGTNDGIEHVVAAVKEKAPEADMKIKEVLKIVKDEELTSLLGKCQKRLEQIVSKDIPETTKEALARSGIQLKIVEDGSLAKPHETALNAVKELLDKAKGVASPEEQAEISQQFSQAFESLCTSAKSDRSLSEIFETVSEKTVAWQSISGQLMQTRSAGLFMEGASRIQQRVGSILNKNQSLLDSVGSKWTKAFTEGDTAVARLKSIELGDAVKTRLVDAIEVRSESAGGLDGIIAGAMSTIKGNVKSGDIQGVLVDLQGKASHASEEAQETLISVLSRRSLYQDVALSRVEEVLCNLDAQFGDGLSPEALASVVRGQGGTAELFRPIAKKAVDEIDSQLSIAESQVTDKTVLDVLKRVRQLVSGDLSVSSLMEEVVSLLDNENVVAAGESIVQHGEVLLDAIEGVSGNKVVNDAMEIVGKAGISKDSVMKEVEKLDVNSLLDTAGSAVSDEKARIQLLSSATDTALDFVLKILPSMPVPPFEGVKDGLIYSIADLSLEGFKVRKENIHIELAGMKATKSDGHAEVESHSGEVKATELLIVDIRRVSAILENAAWGFEQTYMPYLKGSGTADVAMSDGRIRLQFELRRRQRETDGKWEPVLCLHDRTCTIGEVEMKLQGDGRLTWILNKLASVFKGPLRDYVVKTIVRVLSHQSGWILSRLNQVLSPYWELILRTAKLELDKLLEADESVVVEQSSETSRTTIELIWRDRLPLGMNLLTNDESGHLKVVDFPRGSQARSVCERRQLDAEMFKGARIVAVNGSEFDSQDDLFDALRDPGRPKTVMFQIANSEEAKSVADFVKPVATNTEVPELVLPYEFKTYTTTFEQQGDIGIELRATEDGFALEVVSFLEGDGGTVGAAERSGEIKSRQVLTHVNDKVAVGYDEVGGQLRAVGLLAAAGETRPIRLTFSDPYLYKVAVIRDGDHDLGGPSELRLDQDRLENGSLRVRVKSLGLVSGVAESSGILIGDHLVFVNGIPVGTGARWLGESPSPTFDDVIRMLKDTSFYPIGLTFARPRRRDSRWDVSTKFSDTEADTFCVTAESFNQLGCVFQSPGYHEVVVSDFEAVPGVLNAAISRCRSANGRLNVAVEAINGELVPSYASTSMVTSALSRCWKLDSFELLLSDDDQRRKIRGLELE